MLTVQQNKKGTRYLNIPETKKKLVWSNFKRPDNTFHLDYCQNCGELFDEYITGKHFNRASAEKGICSFCGFNHQNLDEFNNYLTKEQKAEYLKELFDSNCIVFSITVNCNDFFGWGCADSYDIESEWFPLLYHLMDIFGLNGLDGLVCWLKGRLPMTEILRKDKRIIQVLLYLRRLTGVTFNPLTRERLTQQMLFNKIEYGIFDVADLTIGVEKGWITNTNKKQLLAARKSYEIMRSTLVELLEERNGGHRERKDFL